MSYDNTDRGVLFKNRDKKEQTHADYQGNINVGGVEYWLNAWIKQDKNGNNFMSLSVKPKQPAPQVANRANVSEAPKQRQAPQRRQSEDDYGDCPF